MAYLFVDAGYLRPIVSAWGREWFGRSDLELDPRPMGYRYQKCFYYDCAPERAVNEAEQDFEARAARASEYIRKIKRVDGWHVYEGTLRRHKGKLTQKEVDVAIAVDLLTHTHRKNTESMSLVAGDLDFRPVVDAVVREGMYLHLFHAAHASEGLMDAADARTEITPFVLHSWMSNEFQGAHPLPTRASQSVLPHYGATPVWQIGYRDGVGVAHLHEQADGRSYHVMATVPDLAAGPNLEFKMVTGSDLHLVKKTFEYWAGTGDLQWVAAP